MTALIALDVLIFGVLAAAAVLEGIERVQWWRHKHTPGTRCAWGTACTKPRHAPSKAVPGEH